MNKRVLLVDDDTNVLEGFRRQLHKMFDIKTALSGYEALSIIQQQEEQYAVVVSDMQMPGMNGIEFLKKLKDIHPETVRIMLTGNADLQTAMDSVNEGHIFRFHTKPCPPKMLGATIMAGTRQYQLITAEKELLEKTLSGSIKVLTEILGLINPTAFGHSIRIGNYVEHMVEVLGLKPEWHYKLAATLSQIGCVTIPQEILDKVYTGKTLMENEKAMVQSHPNIAKNLIEKIPRLGTVARMIEAQGQEFQRRTENPNFAGEDPIALGGHLIKVALDFDKLILKGSSLAEAANTLSIRPREYLNEAVSALRSLPLSKIEVVKHMVTVKELNTNMVLEQDIRANNGILIAIKGQEISFTMIQRLKSFSNSIGVREPFEVSTQ